MNIIAIDPGVSKGTNKEPHGTGIAVFEKSIIKATYFIRGTDSSIPFKKRMDGIVDTILSTLPDWPRYQFVLERSSYQRNVNVAYITYGMYGVLDYMFGPIVHIAPTTVKKIICGNGHAEKKDIYQKLQQIYAHQELFKHIHWEHDDCVDAVAIGLAYIKQKGG